MGHSHNHGHGHEVRHFGWCRRPWECYCEVIRFLFATLSGLVFASVVWWLSHRYAGSYGAEGDAAHILSDSMFMFTSVFLALWKHHDKKNEENAEAVGIVANTLFLLMAAMFILYHTFLSDDFHHFSSRWMAVAGMIGLIGNLAQYRILESGDKPEDEGVVHVSRQVSILSLTKQHVFYDILNSAIVIAGAGITLVVSQPRIIDKGLVVIVASAMILSCRDNWKGFRHTRKSHAH